MSLSPSALHSFETTHTRFLVEILDLVKTETSHQKNPVMVLLVHQMDPNEVALKTGTALTPNINPCVNPSAKSLDNVEGMVKIEEMVHQLLNFPQKLLASEHSHVVPRMLEYEPLDEL